MQRRLPLVEKHPTVEWKSKIFECKVLSTVQWSGRLTGGHTLRSHGPCNTQETSLHAETGNKCQRQPSNTGGNMRFKLPCFDEEQP